MNGDELLAWVDMMTQASVAHGLKRDDLWRAMAELTPSEKEKVIADMKGVAAYIEGVAHMLATL